MKSIIKILAFLAFFVSAEQAFAQTEIRFNIATFNLRMDTPKDSLNAWPNRKEFVKNLMMFHDFDLVGTQEAFIHQIKGVLELPGYAYVGVGRDDGKSQGEHSAIFYKTERFQLLDTGNFWLSETPELPGKGWDATCCNRIATWAKFSDLKTKKQFYVFNAHFDHQGKIARRESAKLMISKISTIAKNAPVFLVGDFNSTPDAETIAILKSAYQDSYDITKLPPYGPVGTANSFKLNAPLENRIDYIFIKGNIEVKKYGALTDFKNQRFPSDHLPVMAEVEIK